MTLYVENDISFNFSGDINLDQKGDIKLANSLDTRKSIINFILRTDHGEYAPNNIVGANLGSFIGAHNNRETHEHMEYSIITSLSNEIFDPSDISADVLPLDINDAVCFISVAGQYLISGRIINVEQDIQSYSFPYMDGEPSPLTIQ